MLRMTFQNLTCNPSSDNLYGEKHSTWWQRWWISNALVGHGLLKEHRALVKYTGIALTMHTTCEKSYFCTSGLNILSVVLFGSSATCFPSWRGKSWFWHKSSTSLNHSLIWTPSLTPLLQEVCGTGYNFFAGLLQLVRKAVLAPVPPLLCSV